MNLMSALLSAAGLHPLAANTNPLSFWKRLSTSPTDLRGSVKSLQQTCTSILGGKVIGCTLGPYGPRAYCPCLPTEWYFLSMPGPICSGIESSFVLPGRSCREFLLRRFFSQETPNKNESSVYGFLGQPFYMLKGHWWLEER